MNNDIITPGRTAVITGAARGIGAATARRLAKEGMNLCLFDRDGDLLRELAASLAPVKIQVVQGDVTRIQDLTRLCDTAYETFGEVALLLNNAGILAGASPWGELTAWRHQLETNLLSIVSSQSVFVPKLLAQSETSAVVNLGSKEGITTPPGNAAYSVAKAGVKVLTEQLAHELRERVGEKISAHLLVPGYTWTPMNFPNMREQQEDKPPGTWTADQLVDYFLSRLRRGDFYIICPDDEVSSELDAKRILWAAEDMIENRPALSRWRADWRSVFEKQRSD